MRTVYSNTRHPLFIKWSSAVALVLGIVCLVLYVVHSSDGEDSLSGTLLLAATYLLLYTPMVLCSYYLFSLTIDEEEDAIIDSRNKKYPLRISRITKVVYKESKKGKFRSLFLHDDGVGFMSVRTSRDNADGIVRQLLEAKPTIEVSHTCL